MRHTGRIWGIGFESYTEDIVLVLSCHMEVVCVRLVMLQQNSRQMQLRHMFLLFNSKAMELLADGGITLEIGHS